MVRRWMYRYPDAEVLQEYPDGMRLLYLQGREGLKTVGDYQGHCSYYHHYWTEPGYFDPPLEYFFLLTRDDGQTPGVLMHTKLYEWFRKPHPTDGSEQHKSIVTFMRPGFLTSTSYDEWYPAREAKGYSPEERHEHVKAEKRKLHDAYARSKQAFFDMRERAVREYGPLGKTHPLKGEVDALNKASTVCKQALDKGELSLRLFRGRVFDFRGHPIILLSTTAKGFDYDASDTRYGDKLHEFMGKDLIVSDPA